MRYTWSGPVIAHVLDAFFNKPLRYLDGIYCRSNDFAICEPDSQEMNEFHTTHIFGAEALSIGAGENVLRSIAIILNYIRRD